MYLIKIDFFFAGIIKIDFVVRGDVSINDDVYTVTLLIWFSSLERKNGHSTVPLRAWAKNRTTKVIKKKPQPTELNVEAFN